MLSEEYTSYLRQIGFDIDFSHVTDEEAVAIEDKVGDIYTENCDDDGYPNEEGLICEYILDHIDDL